MIIKRVKPAFFLPRSKSLLISWLQSPSAVILEPLKITSVTVSIVSPSICHEVMGPDAMILGFWMLSFITYLDSILKSRDITFTSKGQFSQSFVFSSGHVWMWELDCKESWVPKNWYFWTVVLEKTLESPLDSKETQPVHPKGNQSWIFIGRTVAKAENPIL